MQTRTQKYAEPAYPLVDSLKGNDIESKYRTLALNLPTMILQAGLTQAIGFLMAKNESHHQLILAHLAELLNYKDKEKEFYQKILQSNVQEYQLLSRKAIEASGWLKRYTQALLKGENK
ncbi:CRISPR-associated protein Cmr5 [Moraxella bovoculi]|uniref:CRISPR type III-B/RAMP module-associated protein Cmr5 n=1 Tax=Moraxella bovoculi 237 TaxID=743974 RepID=A0A066UB23_9GAMM|nr:type III-B CRISPR module-associated protein Cmr5 [Moraxella bovoculi]AKG14987.2 type III-B CRISPR module-associated protein Cmr5 [Moraxella bovoculi]AKG16671.1 type III-B CRISPR module-associated protein Cmr5 [Moraxella bovoculi]AKG18402.1 CRISPR-associated protein Cmr5 [Moraxella bovoculi]KDN24611.1 Cmr5 family CRISPR-associated protein [Moraxella bovoculi 237]NSM10898.1 type III-B CRISPR module-associated protein Cmr5 [Moraxella bovoculi]